jgi:uncharacterized membrane-anchored protein
VFPLGKAEITLPEGYAFLVPADTKKLLESWENFTDGSELGMVTTADEPREWFVLFEYHEPGHIKDDEKLDSKDLLKAMREGQAEANKERAKRGWGPVQIAGWKVEPHYDEATHNLEHGILFDDHGMKSVNYQSKVLSRVGFMSVQLLCPAEAFESGLPELRTLLEQFRFKEGHRYDQVVAGDKWADIGLAALVTGGAAAVAVKTGFLAKLLKVGAKGVVVVAAGIAAFLKKLVGRFRQGSAREV